MMTVPALSQQLRVQPRRSFSSRGARVTVVQSRRPGPPSIIQRSTVSTQLRGPVSQDILTEIKAIIDAAEEGNGLERDQAGQIKKMRELMAAKSVVKHQPKDARGTYGLSSANFFGDGGVMVAQGSDAWVNAVQSGSGGAQLLPLQERSTNVHDEIQHVTEYPGVQALLSTQKHCIFRYGLLHMRGYDHGELRDTKFPQGWKHDYMHFTLKQTNANMEIITMNPIIKIECKWTTAYYAVG
jgi:hypothetical protein